MMIIGIIIGILFLIGLPIVFKVLGAMFDFTIGLLSFSVTWTILKWVLILALFMWFGIHFIAGC